MSATPMHRVVPSAALAIARGSLQPTCDQEVSLSAGVPSVSKAVVLTGPCPAEYLQMLAA